MAAIEPDETFDRAAEEWLYTGAAAACDALKADPSRAISAETVRGRFEGKWAARS